MQKIKAPWLMAAIASLMLPVSAFAQDNLTGVKNLNDRIDQIQEDAQEDLDKANDPLRYSANGVPQGWRGSLALSASATSGNTDNRDLSAAGRLTYGVNDWSHTFGFAAEYGKANGITNNNKVFGTYEGSRYFNPKFYVFGTARFEFDDYATNERDVFVGFGPGFRILNSENQTWRIQAGPGYRYVKTNTGTSDRELGWIASSRYYYGFTDTMSLTNDTDVLGSSINTIATNDLGLNFKMTNNLSTRVSYRTEYNSDPLPGLKSTDNTIGLSLVIGF